ncbi:MAG: hypothetical protein ACT4P6_23870 [Gemmatimonadaceae bacterium]
MAADDDTLLVPIAPPGLPGPLPVPIQPPPPPGPTPIPAAVELPRVTVDTRYPTTTGRSIAVNAGGNLQDAINLASRGDEIVLQAGATFTGGFLLPEKPGTASDGWIVIRTSHLSSLPPEGTRATPQHAVAMPKLVAANASQSVISTAANARGYRLVGLEISAAPTVIQLGALVRFGDGSAAQNDLTRVPTELVLDRSYVHGHPLLNLQRCVTLNSATSAIIDSYLSECHGKGFDSQAILGWNGPGPFKIENNYLEGAGENVMFGGADPAIQGLIPSDIEIRRNHFYKPPAWVGLWTVKNLLELKQGSRVLVEGNVFENCWVDGGTGFAINFKSVNQGGRAPWASTSDITFRYNAIRNVAAGITLAAHPEVQPAVAAKRLLIAHNLFENVGSFNATSNGRMIVLQGGLADVTITHNTLMHGQFTGSGQFILMDLGRDPPGTNLIVTNNISTWGGPFGAVMGRGPQGMQALASYSSKYAFERNVVIGLPRNLVAGYPPNNSYPAIADEVGFMDVASGDYRLASWSPHRGAATTSADPGADISTLRQKITGVVIP